LENISLILKIKFFLILLLISSVFIVCKLKESSFRDYEDRVSEIINIRNTFQSLSLQFYRIPMDITLNVNFLTKSDLDIYKKHTDRLNEEVQDEYLDRTSLLLYMDQYNLFWDNIYESFKLDNREDFSIKSIDFNVEDLITSCEKLLILKQQHLVELRLNFYKKRTFYTFLNMSLLILIAVIISELFFRMIFNKPQETAETEEAIIEQEEYDFTELKILIADDDEINQEVLKGFLMDRCETIDIKSNGAEVLDSIEDNNSYDIILMDIKMPILDGIKTSIKLRENSILIPIIAISAKGSDEDKNRYLSIGIDAFIAKPLRINDLYKNIHLLSIEWKKKKTIFDFNYINSIFKENIHTFINISGIFFNRYESYTIDSFNREEIHKIKGSSGSLGFKKIKNLALVLHEDCDNKFLKVELVEAIRETKKYFYSLFISTQDS